MKTDHSWTFMICFPGIKIFSQYEDIDYDQVL